jgi:phage terminase small subunit
VSLGEDGARRWSAIVGSRPADYFGESDLLLLEDMIRSEQFVTDCDQLIAEHGHVVTGSTGALVVNPAVNARKGYIATITTIQRALRLPPSTRYDKKSAKLGSTASKRPWQE